MRDGEVDGSTSAQFIIQKPTVIPTEKRLFPETISINNIINYHNFVEIIKQGRKNMNVDKDITKVNNANYEKILSNIGLDSVVSPKEIFCSHIIRHIRGMGRRRGSEFKTLYRLVGNKVEVIFEYGSLIITKENDEFYMCGPGVLVAENIIKLNGFKK